MQPCAQGTGVKGNTACGRRCGKTRAIQNHKSLRNLGKKCSTETTSRLSISSSEVVQPMLSAVIRFISSKLGDSSFEGILDFRVTDWAQETKGERAL